MLGGTTKTAVILGVTPQAVSNWIRRGSVPLAHASAVVSAARAIGVEVSYRDLLE